MRETRKSFAQMSHKSDVKDVLPKWDLTYLKTALKLALEVLVVMYDLSS